MSSCRAVVLSLVALAATGCCRRPAPTSGDPGAVSSGASADAVDAPPPKPSRCEAPPVAAQFVLGDASGSDAEESLPFAAEVGDGVSYAGGFVVGALAPDPKGAAAVVVTMGPAGQSPRTTSLGVAHGDTPPPRVAAGDPGVFAALLEAGPSSRRLRVARVEDGAVTWGPSFDQGRDESLAYDIALGESRGVLAWDDDEKDPDRGVIRVASFAPAPFGSPTAPRTITGKRTDAESPRVVPRAGGFWLAYIARHPEAADTTEARSAGEATEFRWLEIVPLDANAVPSGAPRRLTPENGHVLTYDIEPSAGGGAVIAYRDDDVPSGAVGGVVLRVVVRPDGVGDPTVLADRHVGTGAPTLLPGWLAIADASEETRLARLGTGGELLDRLESEPVLGRGEPIAARGDSLLVSRPRGIAVRLFVAVCHAGSSLDGGPAVEEPSP